MTPTTIDYNRIHTEGLAQDPVDSLGMNYINDVEDNQNSPRSPQTLDLNNSLDNGGENSQQSQDGNKRLYSDSLTESQTTAANKRTAKRQKKSEEAENKTSSKKSGGACRDDSSLRRLTKEFVKLIAEAEDGVLDLNHAAEVLHVQKRRIYDITNVLEGIGLIEKKSKNNIQWKGAGIAVTAPENNDEYRVLQREIDLLALQEKQLDDSIEQVQKELKNMTESEEYQKKAFVTYSDIRNIESLRERTVIAIRAPSGTTLTVPDPDDGMEYPQRRFQIYLQSPSAPIKVYLLSGDENVPNERDQNQTQGTIVQPPEYDPNESIEHLQQHSQQQHAMMEDQNAEDPDFIYSLENETISDLYNDITGGGGAFF
ncbi:transcription factor E2FA [Acrasis kona]|uniref:Transcription factor E2FA n=1 Tax=Acrasis kona TaxID=1008807 RepID=A0AAW2Z4E8_9EUKA